MNRNNHVHLKGTLVKKDPLKYTQNQKALLSFYVKVEENIGQSKEFYTYKVVCFGLLAEAIDSDYFPNTLVSIDGKLSSKSYVSPKNNKESIYTDFVALDVYKIEKTSYEVPILPSRNKEKDIYNGVDWKPLHPSLEGF